ncbi:hypothetical protein AYY20_01005 [Photobacterium aquimaris]|nr:hypothetical protein AYY20_01005 [Photobacterium aquimaris]
MWAKVANQYQPNTKPKTVTSSIKNRFNLTNNERQKLNTTVTDIIKALNDGQYIQTTINLPD